MRSTYPQLPMSIVPNAGVSFIRGAEDFDFTSVWTLGHLSPSGSSLACALTDSFLGEINVRLWADGKYRNCRLRGNRILYVTACHSVSQRVTARKNWLLRVFIIKGFHWFHALNSSEIMTTYPTEGELEHVVAVATAPNPLDGALKILLKSSSSAMATRASPFAEPVKAADKLVEDVNGYLFDEVKRVIMQRSAAQFSAWHGATLTAPDVFKGFQFIVQTRGSLVYGVPVVPTFKFTFKDTWVSEADDLWFKHIKAAHHTCTADKGHCKDWIEGLWGSLVGAAKDRKTRERSSSTSVSAAKFQKIEEQQQEGFKTLMAEIKALSAPAAPPLVAPEGLVPLQMVNGKLVSAPKKK